MDRSHAHRLPQHRPPRAFARQRIGARRTTFSSATAFTLLELLFAVAILSIVIAALIGIYLGQSFLIANARAQLSAMNDATRVMEQIRLQNAGCAIPSIVPTGTSPQVWSWDAWLAAQTPNKSLKSNFLETIAVTCQDATGTSYCGPNQVGFGEWKQSAVSTTFDPIKVTVSVGYRLEGRVVGGSSAGPEFTYTSSLATSGSQFYGTTPMGEGPDANNNGVIDAQASLSTLVTCR